MLSIHLRQNTSLPPVKVVLAVMTVGNFFNLFVQTVCITACSKIYANVEKAIVVVQGL